MNPTYESRQTFIREQDTTVLILNHKKSGFFFT